MELYQCASDLCVRGYAIFKSGPGTDAKVLEQNCREIMDHVDAGTGATYNCAGGVSRNTLDDSNLLDTRKGAPPELTIQYHNEMAYADRFPKYIALAMIRRGRQGTGGTTNLCDNTKVMKMLGQTLLNKMKKLGIIYQRVLEDKCNESAPFYYNSWQDAFGTNSKVSALKIGNASDNSILFDVTTAEGRNYMTHLKWCPLFDSSHPVFGEMLFCSILNRHGSWLDAHSYFGNLPLSERPYHCYWGDGSDFDEVEINVIRQAHDICTENITLEEGDLVVIDNLRVQHGRSPYTGERALGLLLSDTVTRQYEKPFDAFQEKKKVILRKAKLSKLKYY